MVEFAVFVIWSSCQHAILGVLVCFRRFTGSFILLLMENLNDVLVGAALVWFVVLGVFEQHLVHVCGGVLEEFVSRVEDDESDLTVTEHRQLIRLLHQTKLTFCKRHLPIPFIANARYLYFLPSHLVRLLDGEAWALQGGANCGTKIERNLEDWGALLRARLVNQSQITHLTIDYIYISPCLEY